MAIITFPTSKDISIEINGRRLAAAQSFRLKTVKESRYVEAFGSAEPVGAIDGRVKYYLELTRVRADEELAEPVDFHALSDFNVVVAGPRRKLIFSGCQWSGIQESAALGELLFETMTAVASKRLEVAR